MAQFRITPDKSKPTAGSFYVEVQGLTSCEVKTVADLFLTTKHGVGSLVHNAPTVQNSSDETVGMWITGADKLLAFIDRLGEAGISPENKASMAQSMRWIRRSQQQVGI